MKAELTRMRVVDAWCEGLNCGLVCVPYGLISSPCFHNEVFFLLRTEITRMISIGM